MKHVSSLLNKQFDFQEIPHAMFYELEHALRFELGGEEFGMDRPMRRFIQAHERANAVAQSLFKTSPEVFVFLSVYGDYQPDKKCLKSLKACGMKRRNFEYVDCIPQLDEDRIAEFGSDLYRHWYVAKLKDKQTISEILWLAIASQMPIEPSFSGLDAYLVDVSNGLILHAYDDRGMDVAATKDAPLKNLFTTYHAWLLENGLPDMIAMFGDDT